MRPATDRTGSRLSLLTGRLGFWLKTVPNLLVLCLLVGLAYWGHEHHWEIPKFSQLAYSDEEAVPDSLVPPAEDEAHSAGRPAGGYPPRAEAARAPRLARPAGRGRAAAARVPGELPPTPGARRRGLAGADGDPGVADAAREVGLDVEGSAAAASVERGAAEVVARGVGCNHRVQDHTAHEQLRGHRPAHPQLEDGRGPSQPAVDAPKQPERSGEQS